MNKIKIPSLSLEVVKQCNIKCEGCNHFTNFVSTKHILSVEEIHDNLYPWSITLEPDDFRIVGGEPFINKNLADVILRIRNIFANSRIVIFTNGLLIKNFGDDFAKKIANSNTIIRISMHSLDKEYSHKISDIKPKLESWKNNYGVNYSIGDAVSTWTWPYRLIENKIYPFEDNDQRLSWEKCPSKTCRQIYKGKLYKCQLTAYMQDVVDKMDSSFLKYLDYKPAEPTDSYDTINQFINQEDEKVCGACPINPKRFHKKIT
jgi:uncharacterized Fe-S cluster-containing radical SAM superfamily protein